MNNTTTGGSVVAVARNRGTVDAWTTRNFDPRGRFIATPFNESQWPIFKKAYTDGFEGTLRIARSGR